MNRTVTAAVVITTIAVLALLPLGCGQSTQPKPPGTMVEATYIVQKNDTLIGIAQKFIKKNTYGPRNFDEFYEGIYELNYESVFMKREIKGYSLPKMVFPGDTLKIRYWIREEDDQNVSQI